MRRLLVAIIVISLPLAAQQLREQITVERILVDARVVDNNGDLILGLTPADFIVRVDGKPATVEAADWIPETAAQREIADVEEPESPQSPASPPRGRLFIYFFQTDFARNAPRIGGQLSFLHYADEMIDDLEEGDRVCVFSFDSHLKFRLDFTDDKRQIKDAIREAVLINEPPKPPIVPNPSVARHLEPKQMKDCKSSDEAFILIANAVRGIQGPKSMILFGWGLGKRSGGQVVMDRKYPIARYALETSRVTVFAIDTTQADYHDLELGLQQAAYDTGGLYARAFRFPQLAVNQVQKALGGHYELEVRKPDITRRGTHTIEVEVKRRGANVLARSTYVDSESL
ncbi:MAG TPA: VWA domain-containing protein [Thermoanaerobaculia bacterium]|nr:VWA domain-containing protein [Thermoanaerobaculia bacterium]